MATNYRSKGSTNFGTTAYWLVAGAATALANNQDLRINEGVDSFDSGLTQALDFLSVTFEESYGDLSTVIGSASSPIAFDVNQTSTGRFKFLGRCAEINIGGASKVIWDLLFAPKNPNAALNIDTCSSTNLTIENGVVTVGENYAATNIYVLGGTVTIKAHQPATNAPNIYVLGGTVILQRDWTVLQISGKGKVVTELPVGVTGGTVELVGDPAEASFEPHFGDTGNCIFRSGLVNLSKIARALTVGTVDFFPAATEVLARAGANWTTGTRTDRGTGPAKRTV